MFLELVHNFDGIILLLYTVTKCFNYWISLFGYSGPMLACLMMWKFINFNFIPYP